MANGMPSMSSAGMGELFARLRFVLVALLIYRIGTHIPVPGIDPEQLASLFDQNQGTILGLANVFSGGALERMSILALGILPYISASIIMQLMTAVTPQLEQLKKEGEAGRRKISQWTRYLTVVLALVQGTGMTVGLANQGLTYASGLSFYVTAVASLVTGAVFMMWLGEQITERGVGNGISLLIFAGIVAGLPAAIGQSLEQARQGEISILILLGILVLAMTHDSIPSKWCPVFSPGVIPYQTLSRRSSFFRLAGGQASRRMPSDRPREASTSLISVSDFLPRFGVLSSSTSVRCTKSPM
jgi:preprotein translocase subunit SecY